MNGSDVDLIMGAPLGRKTRLRVTPEQIQWGDTTIAVGQVEHAASYTSDLSMDGFRVTAAFQCWLADVRAEVSINLGAGRVRSQEQRLAEASAALWNAISRVIAPRLVEAAATQVRGGSPVSIGGRQVIKPMNSQGIPGMVARWRRARTSSTVVVGPGGVELRGEDGAKAVWEWPSITACTLARGQVVLTAAGKDITLLPMTYRDAILLPSLVDSLRIAR